MARVKQIGYYPAAEVPFPIERTKHIIRRADESELALLETDDWSAWCPVVERMVDADECVEIGDVANDYISERILEDYDPPISWSEEKAALCRACKFHMK